MPNKRLEDGPFSWVAFIAWLCFQDFLLEHCPLFGSQKKFNNYHFFALIGIVISSHPYEEVSILQFTFYGLRFCCRYLYDSKFNLKSPIKSLSTYLLT